MKTRTVITEAEPNGVGLFSQQGFIITNKGFLCAYYVRDQGKKYEANYEGKTYEARTLKMLVDKLQEQLDGDC